MKSISLKTGFLAMVAILLLASCAPATPVATQSIPTNAPAIPTASPSLAPTNTAIPMPATGATSTPQTPSTLAATTAPAALGSPVTFTIVPSQSTADYRVQEQLASLNFPTEAIGKTNAISGQIVLNPDGSVASDQSKFVVDVSTLQSDKSMRDNYVRRNILQTDQYSQVVFVPTSVSGLPAQLPTSGSTSFKLTGNLTIQTTTKPVTWDVTANVQNGGLVTGHASTSFKFEDFNLNQPRVPVVLSVVDHITLEVDFTMQQAGK